MMTTVVVFGGGGFLGRRLVHRLTTEGMSVRVAVRHPDRARIELRSMGFDRVTVVPADVRDQASVSAAVAGANAVVNMVSAYVEKGGVTFEAVHVQGAETVARETVAAGVPRLVLVSGIGADADSRSPYIRARGRGEQVVQQTFPEATIVRPGAMFGPGDALFGSPRVFPARISAAKAGTSSSRARDVMLLSFARSRSVARRPQACSRFSCGVKTEFTPASVTSRRMNGRTVVGRSDPWAKPQAATTPSYLICVSTFASVRLPSESTAPAQRSLSNGTPAPESSRASMILSAPSPRR